LIDIKPGVLEAYTRINQQNVYYRNVGETALSGIFYFLYLSANYPSAIEKMT
jgi:hypothetical protein